MWARWASWRFSHQPSASLGLVGPKVGRVGVCIGGVAEIFPVNFALMDEAIVFRTGEGTKLYVATRNHVLAFEVDDFDDEVRHGWSVLVTGPSDEITEPNELLAARELLAGTWVPTDRYHVLRIDPERISGRQIVSR
jgi:uncharacterized protein